MTVLFACYKAEDDWEDEHSLKGLAYSYLLGKKCRKKPLLYADKVRSISLAMQDFVDAEKQGDADIDTMAGLFGKVMAQIVSCREDECRQILTMMMSECCKEFEQLPILQNVDILRNILYSGVWCRYEIVREKREKDSVNEVTGNDL